MGGDPTPYLLYEVDAELTSRARTLIARGATDGTALHAVKFSLGSGGLDPFDYSASVPVNPDASDLDRPLVPALFKDILHYEQPNPQSACVYCFVDSSEANDLLGELAVWARIVSSPRQSEVGTYVLAAVAHFPLLVKNDSMRYVFRVNVLL